MAASAADIAVVGLGAVNQKQDATIMRSGYISSGEQLMLARRGRSGISLATLSGAKGN